VVGSEAEAEDLVDAALASAKQLAEDQAKEIVSKRERKARKTDINLSPLRLDEPSISVSPLDDGKVDAAWTAEVAARMQRINDAYAEVARRYETMLLMRHQAELDEEDTLVSLLLHL